MKTTTRINSSSTFRFCCALLLVLGTTLTSCQKSQGTHIFHSTQSDGWTGGDSKTFQVPPAPKADNYELHVELRIDNRYPYQDMWLVLDQTYETKQDNKRRSYTTIELRQREEASRHKHTPPHHQHYCDTLHLELTDGHRLNGTGRDLLVYRFPVRSVHLVRQEQGTIAIRHIMDSDTLPGVHDVGISFMPVK